jgi:hypothetical protein
MIDLIGMIDSPGDWLRLLIFITCATCLLVLAFRLVTRGRKWNPKTRDIWFAMMTWSLAGVFIGVQGIQESLSISPRTLLVTIAALVTLNALRRSGEWGDDD